MNRRDFLGILLGAPIAPLILPLPEPVKELTAEERLEIAAKQWEDAFRKAFTSKPDFALAS